MVSVGEAEKIILSRCRDFGTEKIPFQNSIGRVLAEDIVADRDQPPVDRVTMDGIAIDYYAYQRGVRIFQIHHIQSAGEAFQDIEDDGHCVEIMTGAALPPTTNTVIPYEDLTIENGIAKISSENVVANQNVHPRGKDKKQYEILVDACQSITPAILCIAATVGKSEIRVMNNPKIVIVSTGDELVDVGQTPDSFQIRRSNDHTILGILKQYSVPAELMHLPDNQVTIAKALKECIDFYDVILLTGGVSMGKFDFIPAVLEDLQVDKLFHRVSQKPGKPFWFGTHAKGTTIFAFPGNPVSTFMCMYRYFLPWFKASLKLKSNETFAILNRNFTFKPSLQYFLQVKLSVTRDGQLVADPVEGHGSGDLTNLANSNAFLELPLERSEFTKGEPFRVWVFKQIL